MPRQGITEDAVADAITALKAADKPTSYRAIRKQLGNKGSLSTIANHVRELQRQGLVDAQPIDSDKPVLPDAVMKGFYTGAEAVWTELMDAADAVVEEQQAEADEGVAAANATTEQAVAQRDTADAESARQSESLKRTERDLRQLTSDHNALRAGRDALDKQLAVETERADGLAKLVAELNAAKAQLTADLAGAERMAEERIAELTAILDHERTQFAQERTEYQSSVAKAEQREQRLRTAVEDAQSALANERVIRAEHDATIEALRPLVDVLTKRIEGLEQYLTTERERVAAGDTAIAELETRLRSQRSELAAQEKSVATLAADRRHLEQTLAEQRDVHAAAIGSKDDEIQRLDRLLTDLHARLDVRDE